MKRHMFVTRTSELYRLDYNLRFMGDAERQIRIPAPLVFDFSRRNGYRFSDTQFDEIMGRYQFHDPTEGVEADEEEHMVYPPVQEETVTPWGEGSSSGWGRDLLLHTRIPGRRCMLPTSPSTHGRTSTTRAQEAPQDRSRQVQLRPKA